MTETESEWLSSHEPDELLGYVRWSSNRRKLRLLTLGLARPIVDRVKRDHPRVDFGGFLDAAEQFADGTIDRAAFMRVALPLRRSLPALPRMRPHWGGFVFARHAQPLTDLFVMMTYERLEARWAVIGYTIAGIARVDQLSPEAARALGQSVCQDIRDVFGNPFRPVAFDPSWRTSTAVALCAFPVTFADGMTIADKENYLIEPFVTLFRNRPTFQLVVCGRAFENLQGVHRIALTTVWQQNQADGSAPPDNLEIEEAAGEDEPPAKAEPIPLAREGMATTAQPNRPFEGQAGMWYVTLGVAPVDPTRVPDHASDTEKEARAWLANRAGHVWVWPAKSEVVLKKIEPGSNG